MVVGGSSTHSGLSVSRTCLVFGRQKIWLDTASEVTRNVCLNPPRQPGLACALQGWTLGLVLLPASPFQAGWMCFKTWPGIPEVASSWLACLLQTSCSLGIIMCCWWQESMCLNGGGNYGVVGGQIHSVCTLRWLLQCALQHSLKFCSYSRRT